MIQCLDCNVVCKDKTRQCWAKYQRCINCAIKKYPNDYSNSVHKRYTQKTKPKPSQYVLCPKCNNYCIQLWFIKCKTRKIDGKYCNICRIIVSTSDKISFVKLGEN